MISPKRSWLVLLIVTGLLLSTLAPVFARVKSQPGQTAYLPATTSCFFPAPIMMPLQCSQFLPNEP